MHSLPVWVKVLITILLLSVPFIYDWQLTAKWDKQHKHTDSKKEK